MAKDKSKTVTVDNNMSTSSWPDDLSTSSYVVTTTVGSSSGNLVIINDGSSVGTFSGPIPSGQSINDIVYDLKKEIGQLHRKIEMLENIVREETSEKYEAYKRIAALTTNN